MRPTAAALRPRLPGNACVVRGTKIGARAVSDPEVMAADTGQARVEGGVRLLTEPLWCGSSVLVNKPGRMEALVMVMPRAWFVASVTPRRRRQQLARQQATVPHQRPQPRERPPLRWVFPLLEGIPRVRVTGQGESHAFLEGLTAVTRQVLRLFGERVCRLDHMAPG